MGDRKNGTELFQSINSRPAIAVNKAYKFNDVEYNGTLYVQDEEDNDWVGFVFGYQNMFNFYIVAANMHKKPQSAMWWNLKKISINQSLYSSEGKTNNEGINLYESLLRYLTITWSREPESTILWQDPLKQQWKRKTEMHWNIKHLPSKGLIQIRLFEGDKQILNSGDIQDPEPILGGEIGLYVRSQEKVLFSNLNFACLDSPEKDYSVVGQDYSATEYGEYDGQDYYEGGPVKQDYIGAVKDIDSDSIEEKESDEIFSSDYSGSASKVATEKDGKNNGDAMNKHLNIFDRVGKTEEERRREKFRQVTIENEKPREKNLQKEKNQEREEKLNKE